jgi:hypothetical protein
LLSCSDIIENRRDDSIQRRIVDFEEEWQYFSARLEGEKNKNKDYLLPSESYDSLTGQQRWILEWYGKADTLSLYFQRKTVTTLRTLFWIVFSAVIVLELYADLFPSQVSLLTCYPLLMILSYTLYFVAKKKDWENKYLDYRALAEGLRVQFFWKVSGIEESCRDHYMHLQKTEMEWITVAIEKYCSTSERVGTLTGQLGLGESLQLVLKNWIKNQYLFFSGQATLNFRKQKLYGRLITALFFASPLMSLVLIVPGLFLFNTSNLNSHWIIVTVIATLLVAALLTGYSEKMVFSALAKRYDGMKGLFGKNIKDLEIFLRVKDYEKARNLIKKLGREALLENGNWLLMHRERPLEVPKA